MNAGEMFEPSRGIFVLVVLLSVTWCVRCTPIVGGYAADAPNMIVTQRPPVTPVSFVTQPTVKPPLSNLLSTLTNVTVTGLQLPGLLAFLGIRYAEPPTGTRRFQRPQRLKLSEPIEATKYGPPCPQVKDNEVVGSEDCLFINIYSPEGTKADEGLPVLFWIHGGHYQSGSASQYNPEKLVKKGLVVVTPQYRLGSLGFLSVGKEELPGNAGLFDVGAALMWTKENIHHFGGNPNRIIPAGQGTGASLATFLAVNPITAPVVQGLICLSGTILSPFSVDKAESNTATEVSKADGCNFSKGMDFVRCMQDLPLATLIKGDASLKNKKKDNVVESVASLNGPGPAEEQINDNRFLPSFNAIPVLDAIKKGLIPQGIPLLTGVTNKETCGAVKGNLLESFRNKLTAPSFLEKNILKDLVKANTGLYQNKTINPSLGNLFKSDNYLKFFGTLTQPLLGSIDKVVKLTTDALFNLPVFVLSHLWQKQGKVYLFSYDETPKKSFAHKFLPDLILSSPFNERTGAMHGDDLGMMFKPQDIYGNPIQGSELTDKDDMSVSEYYINMVYEFARTGTPKINGVPWLPFSPDKNNFLSLTRSPKEKTNFNKCEMGLWSGNLNILKSLECSKIGEAAKLVSDLLGGAGTGLLTAVQGTTQGLVTGINNVEAGLTNAVKPIETGLAEMTKPLETGLNNVANPLRNVTAPLETGLTRPLGDLLGSGSRRTETVHRPNRPRQPSNGLLGLGNILIG